MLKGNNILYIKIYERFHMRPCEMGQKLKAAIKNSGQFSGLSSNRLSRSISKNGIKNATSLELIQRLESVRNRISDITVQCDELRTALRQNLPEINSCAKCGEHVMQDEAITYKLDAENRVFCKVCFTEILKQKEKLEHEIIT